MSRAEEPPNQATNESRSGEPSIPLPHLLLRLAHSLDSWWERGSRSGSRQLQLGEPIVIEGLCGVGAPPAVDSGAATSIADLLIADVSLITPPTDHSPARSSTRRTRQRARTVIAIQDATRLPDELPQDTSPEVSHAGMALAHGPTLTGWQPHDDLWLFHNPTYKTRPSHEVVLRPAGVLGLQHDGFDVTARDLLADSGLDATFLLYVMVRLVIQQKRVHLDLGKLSKWLGRSYFRSAADHERYMARLYMMMTLSASLEVSGTRKTEPRSKKSDTGSNSPINWHSTSPLISITGRDYRDAQDERAGRAPVRVSYVAGEWLAQFVHDPTPLEYLGDLLPLARIQSGRPTGDIARSLGLALHQHYRMNAKRLILHNEGDEHSLSVELGVRTTLRRLFSMFPPACGFETYGHNPLRFRRYCHDALLLLRNDLKLIRSLHGLSLAASAPKEKWGEDWLDVKLDIRPGASLTAALMDIRDRMLPSPRKRQLKQGRKP